VRRLISDSYLSLNVYAWIDTTIQACLFAIVNCRFFSFSLLLYLWNMFRNSWLWQLLFNRF